MSSEHLRDALKVAGLDVYDLASLIQVDVKTVQRWISEGRAPYPRHRTRVSRALGVPEDELWPGAAPLRREPPSAREPENEPAADSPADPRSELAGEQQPEQPRLQRHGLIDWFEIIDSASSHIDLLDYTLAEMLGDPRLVDTLLRKGASGAKVRILITGSTDPFLADAELERRLEPGVLLDSLHVPLEAQPLAKHARSSEQVLWEIRDEPGIYVRRYRAHRYNTIIRGDERMLILLHTWGVATADAMMMYTATDQDDNGVYQRFSKHFQDIWDHAVPLDEPGDWEDLEDWEQELDRINQPNHRVYRMKLNEAREQYYEDLRYDRHNYEATVEALIDNYRRDRDEEQ